MAARNIRAPISSGIKEEITRARISVTYTTKRPGRYMTRFKARRRQFRVFQN